MLGSCAGVGIGDCWAELAEHLSARDEVRVLQDRVLGVVAVQHAIQGADHHLRIQGDDHAVPVRRPGRRHRHRCPGHLHVFDGIVPVRSLADGDGVFLDRFRDRADDSAEALLQAIRVRRFHHDRHAREENAAVLRGVVHDDGVADRAEQVPVQLEAENTLELLDSLHHVPVHLGVERFAQFEKLLVDARQIDVAGECPRGLLGNQGQVGIGQRIRGLLREEPTTLARGVQVESAVAALVGVVQLPGDGSQAGACDPFEHGRHHVTVLTDHTRQDRLGPFQQAGHVEKQAVRPSVGAAADSFARQRHLLAVGQCGSRSADTPGDLFDRRLAGRQDEVPVDDAVIECSHGRRGLDSLHGRPRDRGALGRRGVQRGHEFLEVLNKCLSDLAEVNNHGGMDERSAIAHASVDQGQCRRTLSEHSEEPLADRVGLPLLVVIQFRFGVAVDRRMQAVQERPHLRVLQELAEGGVLRDVVDVVIAAAAEVEQRALRHDLRQVDWLAVGGSDAYLK